MNYTGTEGEIVSVETEIEFSGIDLKGKPFLTGEESRIRVMSESVPEGEAYVHFSDLYYLSDFIYPIQVGNKSLQVLQRKDLIRCFGEEVSDYWVKIDMEKGVNVFDISFLPDKRYSLSDVGLYIRDTSGDDKARKELEKYSLKEIEIRQDDWIEGKLDLDEDRILFLSIPYSRGWSAYVNGEEREILKADIGFSAVPLEAGQYEIKLVYWTPGLRAGAVISGIALVGFGCWGIYEGKKKWVEKLEK